MQSAKRQIYLFLRKTMADTNFIARRTVIEADWLNDVNDFVYTNGLSKTDAPYLNAKKEFGAVGDGITDDTAALQAAINYCWANCKPLYIPSGVYITTGLVLNNVSAVQKTSLTMFGDAGGNPFAVWSSYAGTVIKSVTDAPVFKIDVPTVTTSAGTLNITNIVFDGTSTTPVVYLEAFYGIGKLSQGMVFQRGTGNGIQIDWMTTCLLDQFYVLNKDWNNYGLGNTRTGIGIYLSHKYDSGLQTIRKCTSRGFLTGYKIGVGGTSNYTYNASIENCEVSVTYNGIHLTDNARATYVNNCYFEGGEGGTGIHDEGDYNKIYNSFTFAGYGTHLKSTSFTYGNVYEGNVFAAGSVANQILIDINSTSANGGPGKSCTNNHLSFGGSGGTIAGVVGLKITGTDPRLSLIGNSFSPRGNWVGGAGTIKILDASAGGVFGITTTLSGSGNLEIPTLSRGAISFAISDTGLSQLNVTGNTLAVPGGTLFNCNASSAVTVNRLSTDTTPGRFLIFKTENANMTFTNSAYLILAGGVSFTGPGTLVLYTDIIGSDVYAFEVSRTVF